MAMDLGLLRYPSFVYGKSLSKGELPPVLCLHTGTPEAFESLCRYLSHNSLNTLNSADYLARLQGSVQSADNDVYLTFDDGHLSIWTVVEPLLHKYGLSATSFLIPGRMPDDGSAEAVITRLRLDDAWANKCSVEDVVNQKQSAYSLATWTEIRSMNARGSMDFQAHTLNHSLVVISNQITGFVTPDVLRTAHPFELATLVIAGNNDVNDSVATGTDASGVEANGTDAASDSSLTALGTPIYASASRMSSHRAGTPAPEASQTCVQLVQSQGGEAFFEQADWQKQLRQQVSSFGKLMRVETAEEQYKNIYEDLSSCREQIEAALPGSDCSHLAYPWGAGSDVSTRAAREAGYSAVYWGKVESRLSNTVHTDPLMLARIGEDFIRLLPGKDRTTLTGILKHKLTRRMRAGSPYLSH